MTNNFFLGKEIRAFMTSNFLLVKGVVIISCEVLPPFFLIFDIRKYIF